MEQSCVKYQRIVSISVLFIELSTCVILLCCQCVAFHFNFRKDQKESLRKSLEMEGRWLAKCFFNVGCDSRFQMNSF